MKRIWLFDNIGEITNQTQDTLNTKAEYFSAYVR